jgi:iron complex outermembrane recepter protein
MRNLVCILLLLNLSIISNASFPQGNGSVIKGKVTDQNGNPLAGAAITIEKSTLGVHADVDGNYMLEGLKDGVYELRFSFIGFEALTREVNLKSEAILNVSLSAKTFMTEEVFISATRAGEHAPLSYSSVSKEAISKSNTSQDIPYILNYTPSIVVSSDAGTGVGYTNIAIRGADVKRINVTIDGIPVNDAESHGVWWVDLPDLASSTDNVQIQRGVGSSTNGAGAFGATVNFQTEGLRREPYAEVNSSYGSYNTSKNTINTGTGLINNKFAVDMRLSKIWSDGYIDRSFSDLKSFYVSGSLYGKSGILKVIVFSGVEHTYQAWAGVPKDSLKTNRTFNPYSYENETDNYWQDNYQIHYSKKINSNLNTNVALHYTKGRGYYENLNKNSAFSSYNLPDAIFNSDTITSTDLICQKWLENDFYGLTYSLNYSNRKINAVLGGGWNNYAGNHFGDVIWAGIVTFNGEKYRWYTGTGDKSDFNTFLKVNYLLTEKINFYADLQLRKINYSIGGFDDNLKDVAQNHKYNFFNPKTGLFFSLSDKQKLYASFGISQREPDRGNFIDADPGKTPVPEKLFDYEAGYEFQASNVMVKGNLFYMNYIDQLILTGKINDVGAPVMTNIPKSYRLGIEVEAGIQVLTDLNWYGNLSLSRNIIPVFLDYTDNWDTGIQNQETLKNKPISFSPSVIAASVLDYNPVKNLHLGVDSKFVGKQYIDNTENSGRMLDRYMVQNFSVSYLIKNKMFKELTCKLLVNNLFDKKYETNGWVYKYIEGSTQQLMDGYFPQAGINYMFNVVLKF